LCFQSHFRKTLLFGRENPVQQSCACSSLSLILQTGRSVFYYLQRKIISILFFFITMCPLQHPRCEKIVKIYSSESELQSSFVFLFLLTTNCWFHSLHVLGHAVAKWLRHCATNRKVAESISDGVIGIFH
jgi:hypothetical protein